MKDTNKGREGFQIVYPGDGRRINAGDVQIRYALRGQDDLPCSVIEYHAPPRFRAPPVLHWHTREHALFFMLEGTLCFETPEGSCHAAPGALVHLPPYAAFRWSNPHDEPARFLCLYAPGGFEEFHSEVKTGLDALQLQSPTPEAMATVIPPLWRKYGIEAEN